MQDMVENNKYWTTYRMEDGSSIFGEYSWVDTDDFFQDLDEPVLVVKETWVLQNSETVEFRPEWWFDYDEDEDDE